jgi:metallo-beta-lactamase family protein
MKITFVGAARTVTGSSHLIETNNTKILLDHGMYQGKRKEAFELNRQYSIFRAEEIDHVILSHAHIDHVGNIPTLVKKGFDGNIFSTFATRDLARILLEDSARIQEHDVYFVNKRRIEQGKKPFEPLYSINEALESLNHFVGLNYHNRFKIDKNIAFTYFDAGHILGSAMTLLEIEEHDKKFRIGFTGDIGRKNRPILRDPEQLPDVDILISESTYGNRLHDKDEDVTKKFVDVINRAISRKSKIIIPSFSVGRTQELVYNLREIFNQKLVQEIPVFVDSPLAVNATDIYKQHPECFDYETRKLIIEREDPFGFNTLTYIRDVQASKAINNMQGPMIIISASGMCEGGRVLHHLANNIENPDNIILIVGYSAEHTLGRRITEKDEIVKIFGEEYKLKAEVEVFHSFSAHADRDEMLSYFDKFDRKKIKKFFLVHGDYEVQQDFRASLEKIGFSNIEIPKRGHSFTF